MRAVVAQALLAVVVITAGCTDNGVGRKCINPSGDGGILGTAVSSPALECPSRLCLLQGTGGGTPNRATCTIKCATNDDCAGASISAMGMNDGTCSSSFVCAVAAVAGAFKCQMMCICHEDLKCGYNSDADGGVITPSACPMSSPTPICP